MDVNTIADVSGDEQIAREPKRDGARDIKCRGDREFDSTDWRGDEAEKPYWFLDTVEMKSMLHQSGI